MNTPSPDTAPTTTNTAQLAPEDRSLTLVDRAVETGARWGRVVGAAGEAALISVGILEGDEASGGVSVNTGQAKKIVGHVADIQGGEGLKPVAAAFHIGVLGWKAGIAVTTAGHAAHHEEQQKHAA